MAISREDIVEAIDRVCAAATQLCSAEIAAASCTAAEAFHRMYLAEDRFDAGRDRCVAVVCRAIGICGGCGGALTDRGAHGLGCEACAAREEEALDGAMPA